MTKAEARGLPEHKIASIPEPDRQIILEEAAADPSFCKAILRCMETNPDWAHVISASAKEAAENELDPTKYPLRKGSWPRLRERVRELVLAIHSEARDAANQLTLPEAMKVVRRIAAGAPTGKRLSGLGNLGQWDIIGSIIGNVANVASSVYSATVTANAQKSIAQMQADAAMQGAQAQIAMANAQAAIQAAQAQMNPLSSVVSNLTTSTIAGIPAWAVAVPVVGTLLYMATR